MAFLAAIVGRPNVGKSTLFNRLAGAKLAIVDDTPGVTRDRRVHEASIAGMTFRIMDTAGLEDAAPETLAGRMRAQTEVGIREADIIFFMFDARQGVTPIDHTFADFVRRSGKPVILLANKAESKSSDTGVGESYALGLGDPVAISAEHGLGMADLFRAIVDKLGAARALPHESEDEDEFAVTDVDVVEGEGDEDGIWRNDRPMRIAIVGRPNAGKSTLINAFVGEDRLLTGPEAGITRDSISIDMVWKDRSIRLHDTAGMRRKARVQEKIEKLSVADGLRAIRFAEVVVVLIDVTQPFDKQDLQIADLISREGRAPVLAYSKFDLVEDRQAKLAELREMTDRLLPQIKGVRAVPVSGETGYGLDKLMAAVFDTYDRWNLRVSTGQLNRWFEHAVGKHPPPAVAGRRLKLKYITQAKTRPPGFVISCTRADAIPDSYVRYLTNAIREQFDLGGIPIRMMMRETDNPFAGRKPKRDG
ncbi:MAG: ribosome biogenesis GTPase Der [Phyllobacteriaceae bacterium]|nr:ribosome biogenesis GTPase Der [Phyllobacteriaceae bacterium]